MSLKIPPAVNYLDPLIAVFARWQVPPREGPQMVQLDIKWGTMGGASNCVNVNLSNNATLEFSQIVALSVDNSQCGADVQFIFSDTQETITIPAYSPKSIIPAFTNQTQFYVVGLGKVLSTDITRFSIHNSVPPPVSVSVSEEQNTAAVGGIDMGTATTALVASTINGTLENAFIGLAVNAANSGRGTWSLQDGTGAIIAAGAVEFSAGNKYNLILLELNEIHVRFSTGLNLVCTQTAVLGAIANANIYYRTP